MKRALLVGAIVFLAAGWASVARSGLPAASRARAGPGVPRRPLAAGTAQAGTASRVTTTTLKTGGLALDTLPDSIAQERTLKCGRKSFANCARASCRRPAPSGRRGALDAFAGAIEGAIDHAAANEPESGADTAPSHEPRRIRQRDTRPARAGRRLHRRCCRPTTRVMASTTSPTCSASRRRSSSATCLPRRRSAGWQSASATRRRSR